MDPAPAERRIVLLASIRIAMRRLVALGVMVCLCVAQGWSAPQPDEAEEWRLLAERVEAVQFRRFVAEGNAEVRWGARRVRAERIEGDLETGWVTATGDVEFTDERGTLHATHLRVNLLTREGELQGVRGQVEGIFITADTIRSDGATLYMQNVTVTTCDKDPPEYLLSAQSLSLSSALRLTTRQASLSLWGRKWVTVPYLSRRVGKRAPGEPLLPQVGYSRRRGLMLYYSDLLPQRWAQVRYAVRIFTRHDPEIRIDLLRRLDGWQDGEPLRHVEPSERPNVSFLETVTTIDWRVTPQRGVRRGAFLSLRANSPVEGLQRTDLYLRGVEIGYQDSQPLLGGLLETEWRIGRLRESPTLVTATRAVGMARWQSPAVPLGRGLFTDVGLDARIGGYTGNARYSWARAQWGLYWDSGSTIRIGAGLSLAADTGNSPFVYDELETRRDARLRVRLNDTWGLDVLGIWDMEHHRWRDWQILVSPPAHCLQPQILWSYQQRQIQVQLSLITR